MINRVLACLATTLLVFSMAGAVAAERRVALVIGNNDYQNVPKLEKAVNDAKAVSQALNKIGFEVMYLPNAGQKKMNQAVNEFAQRIAGGGIGVFFFAGHGLQINNQNFLLPIDIDAPKGPNDVDDQAISLVRLQDKLADAKAKFSLLVIDACRDNPLPKKAGRSLGGSLGLAQPASPNGQIVLFSAGANQQALDKLNDTDSNPNGLFTREFLPMISTPGVSAADALKKVRTTVTSKARSVGHDQNPALYDQTDGDFYFIAGAPQQLASTGPAAGPTVSQSAIELEFWSSIKNSNDPEDFKEYLARYPNGQFASIAQRRVAAVSQPGSRRSTEAAPPPVAAAPAAPVAPANEGPSIASRIELMGPVNYLVVSDLRATKRDNLLRIQAEITNTSTDNQQLYYRFKWLDRDGFSVWDDEPWKPLLVYGNQKQLINVVSPSFKATDFRIVLQSPN
jgi:uncharacterized caspase-like protein/uncharacterized protein YcfL